MYKLKINRKDLFIVLIKNYQEKILESIRLFKKYLELNSPSMWKEKGLLSDNTFGPNKNYYYSFCDSTCHFKFIRTNEEVQSINYKFNYYGLTGGIHFGDLVSFVYCKNNFFDEFKDEQNFRNAAMTSIKYNMLRQLFKNEETFYVTKKCYNQYPFLYRWIDPLAYTKTLNS